MERCDVREAAAKLKEWFKVGETPLRKEVSENESPGDVPHGIYRDSEGSLFEVTANAISGEDLEPLIVYRELFGDYRFWVASPQNFGQEGSLFTLVKTL
jgi:hypothetical protein